MKYFIAILVFIFSKYNIKAQKNYWQQQANFNISVTLNDIDHSLTAHETIEYTNNSPDTLKFIWFHVWMNAYKNDQTAFCEQQLSSGNLKFYFSDDEQRGYTNKLDFSVDEVKAKIEAHPKHIDIIKLILPKPLAPKQTIKIETPFFCKLPQNFSRGGHIGNDYQITQWYPKPAVYDKNGWHEMPYLENGEFYSEFGNYEVNINVPENYLVASTGVLQEEIELNSLKKLGKTKFEEQPNFKNEQPIIEIVSTKNKTKKLFENEALKKEKKKTKTFTYKQNNVHDFAWFASKDFLVQYDTVRLQSKTVDCFSFFSKQNIKLADQNVKAIKTVLKNYSNAIGEYQYNTATVVLGNQNNQGGMEYPTITYINCTGNQELLHNIIYHEVGHNWFYGMLGSNERDHAWMDEGMNTFYDFKFSKQYEKKKIDYTKLADKQDEKINRNLPIDTTSSAFSQAMYYNTVYYKAAAWLKELEEILGKEIFDKCMQQYFETWKFKHPQPLDFKNVVEQVSGKNIDAHFGKLYTTKPQPTTPNPFKVGFGFPTIDSKKKSDIYFTPLATYNYYDGIRIGALINNFNTPTPKFLYYINPSYATTSKAVNIFTNASYNIFKRNYCLQFGLNYQNYSYDNFRAIDSNNVVEFSKNLSISRFVPQVKLTIYNKDFKSTQRYEFLFKTFYLNQQYLNYTSKNKNYVYTEKSYVNRISISKYDSRTLYPYNINLTADQTEDLIRLSFTAKQFFNYATKEGGISARFFAGKLFYIQSKTINMQYKNYKYWFNLLGTTGADDYTFSDYFIGRNETQRGWMGQQIMERDGFFKTRMDYVSPVGRTDDWLMAANFNIDFPNTPQLKIFVDAGTYAEAWKENNSTGRFLYTVGLQISVLKEVVNVYIPILNSQQFRDYNELYLNNKFWQSLNFSINLLNIKSKLFNTQL